MLSCRHCSVARNAAVLGHSCGSVGTDGARLIGLFDTIIGDGTTNGKSMQSVELRHFSDLTAWQVWREAQDDDPVLSKLIKQDWMPYVLEMHSILMRPLDYSRIR